MTKHEILHLLMQQGPETDPQIHETHISWVLLMGDFAYKIKKPVCLPFLDMRTLEKRKKLCMRELTVNQQLASEVYQGVIPIVQHGGDFWFGGTKGQVVDYAVKMKRMDTNRQLNQLLEAHEVSVEEAQNLGVYLAQMHVNAPISYRPLRIDHQLKAFQEIAEVLPIVQDQLGMKSAEIVIRATKMAEHFWMRLGDQLQDRLLSGYFRFIHGDLHSRNIFLFDQPVFFDAMEFNDEWRRLDVLDELAMLCVDFDFYEAEAQQHALIRSYLSIFPCLQEDEGLIFQYYKLYRANVRAKVSIIRARESDQLDALFQAHKYIELMDRYSKALLEERSPILT
ncbi:MAG: phosphotransferase [Bacteroidota bacterium]